jgi:hypothetical protein
MLCLLRPRLERNGERIAGGDVGEAKLEGVKGVLRARPLPAALCCLLLAALTVVIPPGKAASAGSCGSKTEVYSFTVETKWSKSTYKVGDKAKIEATVLRPGPEDPLNLGIELNSPVLVPAEGVTVTTTLHVGFPPLFSRAKSDADGKVVMSLPLTPRTKGKVFASTVATMMHNANGPACSEVEEIGQHHDVPAFVVK